MADAPAPAAGAAAGGAPRGFGGRGGRGDRGRGRRGPRRGGNKSEEKEWQPVTKLGRLVKAGKIKSMEEIYLHSLPIKEYQDRKSTRLNSSHSGESRMPSSA